MIQPPSRRRCERRTLTLAVTPRPLERLIDQHSKDLVLGLARGNIGYFTLNKVPLMGVFRAPALELLPHGTARYQTARPPHAFRSIEQR